MPLAGKWKQKLPSQLALVFEAPALPFPFHLPCYGFSARIEDAAAHPVQAAALWVSQNSVCPSLLLGCWQGPGLEKQRWVRGDHIPVRAED